MKAVETCSPYVCMYNMCVYMCVCVYEFIFINMLRAYDNQSAHQDIKQYKMDE